MRFNLLFDLGHELFTCCAYCGILHSRVFAFQCSHFIFTVIDLSSLDPEDLLESGQLEDIPQCSFLDVPSNKKKELGATTSRKRQKKQGNQTR